MERFWSGGSGRQTKRGTILNWFGTVNCQLSLQGGAQSLEESGVLPRAVLLQSGTLPKTSRTLTERARSGFFAGSAEDLGTEVS